MNYPNQIEVQFSKLKLTLLLIGAIGFVAVAAWQMFSLTKAENPALIKQVLTPIFCLASMGFFGFIALYIFKKLRENTPALTITSEGITDNSSAVSVGFIPWTDVVDITEGRVWKQSFVSIDLKNPQEYIGKQESAIKLMAMKFNQTTFGMPISISANALECNQKKLKTIIKKKFSEYKKQQT